jgi:uncharacterized Zn-finger protein
MAKNKIQKVKCKFCGEVFDKSEIIVDEWEGHEGEECCPFCNESDGFEEVE